MKSWKTTVAGILGIIASLITMVAVPYLDGDEATVANWTGFVAIAIPAIGLLFARDNNVTSEKAVAK